MHGAINYAILTGSNFTSLWIKFCRATIQIRPLTEFFDILLLILQYFTLRKSVFFLNFDFRPSGESVKMN